MRLSPSGRLAVYTTNAPAPCAYALDGSLARTYSPGQHCRWLAEGWFVFNSQDGQLIEGVVDPKAEALLGPGGNTVAAGGQRWAVGRHDPTRVLTSWGETIYGASHPALSADGKLLAYLMPDVPMGGATVRVRESKSGAQYRDVWAGAPRQPRWSHDGATLAWEDRGHVLVIADAANPNVQPEDKTLPGYYCGDPVPVWTGAEVLVGMVRDVGGNVGELVVREWVDASGYVVARSSGQRFDWDISGSGVVAWLRPDVTPASTVLDWAAPRVDLGRPGDRPFEVVPNGVMADVSAWLWHDQSPDVSLSPDGSVRYRCKSDETSADGPNQIGEWWDRDSQLVGHLEDSSAGYRVYQGQRYNAEEWVRLGQPVPWASLPLDRNTFSSGARLWLPRRCTTGYRRTYVTDISWSPSGWVQPDISIEIRVDVGYGVIHGREVFVRGVYDPGVPEYNYYGPPGPGEDGWVAHHRGAPDPWSTLP